MPTDRDALTCWGALLACSLVDIGGLPVLAVDGLTEAVDALRERVDDDKLLPNEREQMEAMWANFLLRAAARRRVAQAEEERHYLYSVE